MAHNTDTPAIPIALSDSAEKQVEIARDVEALMEHPGWEHLTAAVAAYERIICSGLMGVSGSQEAAKYADLTGEMKGVAKIEPIARGLIDVGEQAKARVREAEIKEVS